MDPLRIKWWGPKHLGPSNICELSLPTKLQPPGMPRTGLKAWSWRKGPKKTLKSPLDPLWGPKHLRSSYFCELSLHTEFQSNSTSPSIKLFVNGKKKRKVRLSSANETEVFPARSASGKWRRSCQQMCATAMFHAMVLYFITVQYHHSSPSPNNLGSRLLCLHIKFLVRVAELNKRVWDWVGKTVCRIKKNLLQQSEVLNWFPTNPGRVSLRDFHFHSWDCLV